LLIQLNTENRQLKEQMNQQQTQVTMVQNENQELEEQVTPIASKSNYMKLKKLFAQKFH
jgi:regulator of replication initiation timing